ncbi:MAG TPA: hypothetical protein VE010_06570 [Thermoanaerobaculia bacterium]|nr:hypothetical protein [Thermoanaerobaculia bacterium]
MSRWILVSLCLLLAARCGVNPPANAHVAAAAMFTERYAKSRLADWKVRGKAAGTDCTVLLIETAVPLNDTVVEALHYGAGAYDVFSGGIHYFSRERAFRAVTYHDSIGGVWTFGAVTVDEAGSLKPCD